MNPRNPRNPRIHGAQACYLMVTSHRRGEQEEQFARDARLASTEKGEAMIAMAVTWTADVLRQMIAEA